MKSVNLKMAVRIKINTPNKNSVARWAEIIDNQTGKTLHTGQVAYIKRTAKRRYGVDAEM